MSELFIAAWFVLGICGVHILEAQDKAEAGHSKAEPGDVWCVLFGFGMFILALIFAVEMSVRKKQ